MRWKGPAVAALARALYVPPATISRVNVRASPAHGPAQGVRELAHYSWVFVAVAVFAAVRLLLGAGKYRPFIHGHHLDVMWGGIDLAECLTMGAAGVLLVRRNLQSTVALSALGALLLFDATLDTGSSNRGAFTVALVMALIAEIPVALISLALAAMILYQRQVPPRFRTWGTLYLLGFVGMAGWAAWIYITQNSSEVLYHLALIRRGVGWVIVGGLLLTAILAYRRSRWVGIVSCVTGVLLIGEAWFATLRAGWIHLIAGAVGGLVAVPIGVLCIGVAYWRVRNEGLSVTPVALSPIGVQDAQTGSDLDLLNPGLSDE